MPHIPLKKIHGEPSWPLATDRVSLAVTRRGGQVAPVIFQLGKREVAPYSLAPWQPSDYPKQPALLQVLRGDFFCLPFGGDNPGHPPHGDTANQVWELLDATADRLVLSLKLTSMPGEVRKTIHGKPGHTVLYQEHVISGVSGTFNYGHHPILHIPDGVTARISVSPLTFGGVYEGSRGNPPIGEYGCLKPEARFRSLKKVPLAVGGTTNLENYPDREGFEDIVMMATKPEKPLAWTAVVFDGYVWLAIRRPRDFPGTLFWMSHGGRHFEPWNSVHRRRIGIEDVCCHFCDNLAISRQNRLKVEGIPTTATFSATNPTVLRHVQAVVPVPKKFGRVKRLTPARDRQSLTLIDDEGTRATGEVDLAFLDGGDF